MATKLPRGLDGRTRDQNPPKAGEIRQKRGDTLVSTLRREYGDDFAAGIRSDAKLETVRERTGKSLHQLVRDMPKKKRLFGAWLTASGRSRQARLPDRFQSEDDTVKGDDQVKGQTTWLRGQRQ